MQLCSAQHHRQTGLCATNDMKRHDHVKYYELLDLKLCCSAVQHKGGKASLLQVGCILVPDLVRYIVTRVSATLIPMVTSSCACSVCGVQSFYRPRSDPDCYAVTVQCIDDGSIKEVHIEDVDGQNWEQWQRERRA